MTPLEFEYIKRAVEALESGECSDMSKVKILRTVGQIAKSAADKIEQEFVARVEAKLVDN
jgi:hypothetical protein